jgi:hypothetical protein
MSSSLPAEFVGKGYQEIEMTQRKERKMKISRTFFVVYLGIPKKYTEKRG